MFNVEKMDNISSCFLEFFFDMDDLLGVSEEFLFGIWLESVKDFVIFDEERKFVSLLDCFLIIDSCLRE